MKQKKEDAVSPVIGIMLMLVVTIIIAAVITGFAMDLSKDTNKTPTALFDVQYENGEFTLEHKGRDPIRLEDMQIVFEQIGTVNSGITYTRSGADGKLTILGQDSKKVATTGDVIKVNDFPITDGSVLWTLTYIPTEGLVASGKVFVS